MKRIFLTSGEPAGIGPEIILKTAAHDWPADLIAIGDPNLFIETAERLKLDIEVQCISQDLPAKLHTAHCLRVLPVYLNEPAKPQQLNIENAEYVINTLLLGHAQVLENSKKSALVTAPVHKSILNDAGYNFSGHTEFLCDLAGVSKTLMLFVTPQFKAALFTTHIPLRNVPDALSESALRDCLILLTRELKNKFKITAPKIAVCGLNPHAGEHGHIGNEEQRVLIPLIQELQTLGYAISGPHPADTIFTAEKLKLYDVILAMYHDQALPIVKYLGFGEAVNVTLGLPYIRTSVDHGTALDIAGKNLANPTSLIKAVECALSLLA